MKICKYCNVEKPIICFEKNRNKCKNCRNKDKSITKKIWKEKNKEKLKIQNKIYFINNKEQINTSNLNYYYSNLEKVRNQSKNYRKENRIKLNLYRKNKLKEDVNYKLTTTISSRIRTALKRNIALKNTKSIKLLGCDISFLKNYLESKFLPTMNWENYGAYWHIDHIIPCSSFNLIDEEEQKKCFHYTNLKPLFAVTQIINGIEYIGNLNKSNKI